MRIQQAREELGITQQELASRARGDFTSPIWNESPAPWENL
jgi:transcriptional regulator with XRE-family HTH domain